MFIARLICSDPGCAEEREAEAPTLDELERLLCDCGCTFEIIAWPDRVDEGACVMSLSRYGSDDPPLRAAA